MSPDEIINSVGSLWINVQKDRDFSCETTHEIERFLDRKMNGNEGLKDLGAELYREVGRSNYPDGDIRRDGIRAMSHFIMGYWDIASGREQESKKRLDLASANMGNYLNNHVNA